MLHVVPALVLLLIQGPSGMDRLPCHGGLPAVLEALNARLERDSEPGAKASNRDAAIASLLALGARDPRWSAAIARFLDGQDFGAPVLSPGADAFASPDVGCTRIPEPAPPLLPAPFAACSRSRDGPVSR